MLTDKIKANGDLFGFELDDGQLIPFKLLNYREYKSLIHSLGNGNPTPEIIFDYIFNKCVLDTVFVDVIEDQQAGLVQTLGELILSLSGPGDKEFLTNLLDQARSCTGTVELQIKATICRVFPGYTMDKLDDLTFPKLVQVFAQAERVMLDSGVIEEPFRISMPSEPDDVEPGQGVIRNADIAKLKTALGK